MTQSKWLRTGLAVMLGATIVAPTSTMATTLEQAKAEIFAVDVKEDNTALQNIGKILIESKVTCTVVEQD